MARLGAGAVVLLQAAAVAGARFELDLVAAAAGLDGEPLLDALDAALASGLVVEEDADRYRFPHDIVRRTLVAQLSAARRRALHRALASAIEDLRPTELDAHAAVLAHHAAAGAGPRGDPRAVHWSRVASAQRRGPPRPGRGGPPVPPGRGRWSHRTTTPCGPRSRPSWAPPWWPPATRRARRCWWRAPTWPRRRAAPACWPRRR